MKYYLDTEFDGLGGPLISVGLVRDEQNSLSFVVQDWADDSWVKENVIPLLWKANASTRLVTPEEGAMLLANFLKGDPEPVIIADWPDDIKHICKLLITGSLYWDLEGGPMFTLPSLTFRAERVDAYPTTLPGAVQHNAWWDAMALCHKLSGQALEAKTDG